MNNNKILNILFELDQHGLYVLLYEKYIINKEIRIQRLDLVIKN